MDSSINNEHIYLDSRLFRRLNRLKLDLLILFMSFARGF